MFAKGMNFLFESVDRIHLSVSDETTRHQERRCLNLNIILTNIRMEKKYLKRHDKHERRGKAKTKGKRGHSSHPVEVSSEVCLSSSCREQ